MRRSDVFHGYEADEGALVIIDYYYALLAVGCDHYYEHYDYEHLLIHNYRNNYSLP